jgi:SAM-dependent methyltransferase
MATLPEGEVRIPEHWSSNTWEEKAKENPLFAVMTTANYTNSDSQEFSAEELEFFFDKGRRVYEKIVKPRLGECRTGSDQPFLVEYGCGMGRILNAVLEDGHRAGGIDISPTMIEHCRKLVPGVANDVYVLDETGRSGMPDACADLVFSFAVLKHIHNLDVYDAALAEMTRVMKPGAVLVLNVNSQDFIHGSFDQPGRTVHYDDRSEHFRYGEDQPYKVRKYSTWSGVYFGYDRLSAKLGEHGVEIYDRFHHTMQKPQGIWVVGRKKA